GPHGREPFRPGHAPLARRRADPAGAAAPYARRLARRAAADPDPAARGGAAPLRRGAGGPLLDAAPLLLPGRDLLVAGPLRGGAVGGPARRGPGPAARRRRRARPGPGPGAPASRPATAPRPVPEDDARQPFVAAPHLSRRGRAGVRGAAPGHGPTAAHD